MALFKRSRFTEIPQDVDLTAIDRESKYRNFKGTQQKLLTAALTCFSLFQLYASLSGMIPQQILPVCPPGIRHQPCVHHVPDDQKFRPQQDESH